MPEVLRVAPDYSNAAGLSRYGWQAVRDAQCEDIIEKLLADGKLYAHMWEEYNKSVHWKVGVQA